MTLQGQHREYDDSKNSNKNFSMVIPVQPPYFKVQKIYNIFLNKFKTFSNTKFNITLFFIRTYFRVNLAISAH
jgi:hypothetical protein